MPEEKPKIYLGSDHAGFAFKEKIKEWLREWEFAFEDQGAYALDEDDDYPDFIAPVAQAVSQNPEGARGIILGKTGEGEGMAANRFAHVRAAVFYGGTMDVVRLCREHNNSNVLSLGAGIINEEEAKEAIQLWLGTPFSGEERHMRRIKKIEALDKISNDKI